MTDTVRMVRIRRTVTVTQFLPASSWVKNASLRSEGEQMSDDEIREFELCGGNKEKLSELLQEAMQMEPESNQDFATLIWFEDVPLAELENNDEDIEEVVPNAGSSD